MKDTTININDQKVKPIYENDSVSTTTSTSDKVLNSDNRIEIINAIGSLWPLLLTLTFIAVIILKWKNISQLIDRIKSAKIAGQQIDFGIADKQIDTIKVEKEKSNETQIAKETIPNTEKDIFQIRQLYIDKKPGEAEELLNEINAKESDKEQICINTTISLYFKYLAGYTNSINEINDYINLQQDNKFRAWGYYFVGESYFFQKDYDLAIQNFENAYQTLKFSNNILVLLLIESISNCIENLQSITDKVDFLFTESKKTENQSIVFDIYKKIAYATDNKLLKIIMLQIVLKEKGNDTSLLFDTSYTLAELEENVLAISYYKQLLKINPNDTSAVNNLGVSYDRLRISSLSNFHYKNSSENGNTLASANLAFNLIHSGFYEEAENILERDRVKENIHENLLKAFNELKIQKDEESKREELIEAQSNKLRSFFSILGNDILTRTYSTINLNNIEFISPSKDKVQINQNSNFIQISWINDEHQHKISLMNSLFYGQAKYIITKDGQFIFQSEKEYSGYYNFNEAFDRCTFIFYNEQEIIDFEIYKS